MIACPFEGAIEPLAVAAVAGRLMDLGVDGIVTDRPDLLRDEMQRRGMALPLATPVQP